MKQIFKAIAAALSMVFFVSGIIHPATLTYSSVTPAKGTVSTYFKYKVKWTDTRPPETIRLVLNQDSELNIIPTTTDTNPADGAYYYVTLNYFLPVGTQLMRWHALSTTTAQNVWSPATGDKSAPLVGPDMTGQRFRSWGNSGAYDPLLIDTTNNKIFSADTNVPIIIKATPGEPNALLTSTLRLYWSRDGGTTWKYKTLTIKNRVYSSVSEDHFKVYLNCGSDILNGDSVKVYTYGRDANGPTYKDTNSGKYYCFTIASQGGGGIYDGVTFTAEEETTALDICNRAGFSQLLKYFTTNKTTQINTIIYSRHKYLGKGHWPSLKAVSNASGIGTSAMQALLNYVKSGTWNGPPNTVVQNVMELSARWQELQGLDITLESIRVNGTPADIGGGRISIPSESAGIFNPVMYYNTLKDPQQRPLSSEVKAGARLKLTNAFVGTSSPKALDIYNYNDITINLVNLPGVYLGKTSGAPGEIITVTGSGFPYNAFAPGNPINRYDIYMPNWASEEMVSVGYYDVDSAGNITGSFTVPPHVGYVQNGNTTFVEFRPGDVITEALNQTFTILPPSTPQNSYIHYNQFHNRDQSDGTAVTGGYEFALKYTPVLSNVSNPQQCPNNVEVIAEYDTPLVWNTQWQLRSGNKIFIPSANYNSSFEYVASYFTPKPAGYPTYIKDEVLVNPVDISGGAGWAVEFDSVKYSFVMPTDGEVAVKGEYAMTVKENGSIMRWNIDGEGKGWQLLSGGKVRLFDMGRDRIYYPDRTYTVSYYTNAK